MPFNWGEWQGLGGGQAAQPAAAQQQNVYQQYWINPVLIAPLAAEEEGAMVNEFRVGCDPEFMLLDGQGKTVKADLYFPYFGPIGYDHGGRVAEFRPQPSRGIMPIIRQIRDLIKTPTVEKTNSRLRSGALCNHDCLGGHVHFGFNAFEVKPERGVGILNGGGKFNPRGEKTTIALDTLTKALEKLDILPRVESNQRRHSGQGEANYYGQFGDVRDCGGHMEYRTMASWLYDPKVAFLVLTMAKLAAVDPEGTTQALRGCGDFKTLANWLDGFKGKDVNAARASEKLIEKGLPHLQVDPTVDFRGRWEELGL